MTGKKRFLETLLFALVLFILCGTVLSVAFPIWREFQYGRYPREHWLKVYCETACALVLACLLAGWVGSLARTKVALSISQPVVFFLLVTGVAVVLGTRTTDEQQAFPAFVQDIHAKFLAEGQFIEFILTVILPISVLSLRVGTVVKVDFEDVFPGTNSSHE
jgi:Na+/H+-dicarboxylate symporter